MPAYYTGSSQLEYKGEIIPRFSITGLKHLTKDTINQLVSKGIVREIETQNLLIFPKLQEYAIILNEKGIITLGDFATAYISDLAEIPNAKALQNEVLEMIHPDKGIDIENCCG